MKTTSEKKRKFNILDFLFLMIVLAVVAFAALNIFGVVGGNAKNDNAGKVTVLIETTAQDPAVLSYMEEDDVIYSAITNKELGKIVSIQDAKAKTLVVNQETQTIDYAEYPDKIDIILEVECTATMAYPDILVDNYDLKVGKTLPYIVGNASMRGTIISVDCDELQKEGN